MRFQIERWDENSQSYDSPVSGEGLGDQAIAGAFEDAGVETVGCYRVSEEIDPDAAAYYDLTVNGELIEHDVPCD